MGNIYVGNSSKIASKIKSCYLGVDGTAHKIKKVYAGDSNNIARLVWSAVKEKVTSFVSSLCKGSKSYTNAYTIDSNYSTFNHHFSNALQIQENVYATAYEKNYYGEDTDHTETGLMFVTVNDTGAPTSYKELATYSLTSDSVSAWGGIIDKYTTFGDGMIFVFCTNYINYTEYTQYDRRFLIYDYNNNRTYSSLFTTELSNSSTTSYRGLESVANNGIIYLEEIYNSSSSTRSFALGLYLNMELISSSTNTNSYTLSCKQSRIVVPQAFTSSTMFMCKLNDNSGIICEHEYYNNKYRFLKYNVDTDSESNSQRITLTDLGTYTFSDITLNSFEHIDENNLLLYGYYGDFMIVTTNTDNSIQLGSVLSLGISVNYDKLCRIGNTNTFSCGDFDTANIVYADIDNKTVSLLGTMSVGTKDHSVSYVSGVTCPYGENATISFPMTIDYTTRTGTINTVVNTFE